MRTISIPKGNNPVSSNYVSRHIEKNPRINEQAKKHMQHKPYQCDFGNPVIKEKV